MTIEYSATGYSYERSLEGFVRGLSEIADRDKTENDKLLCKKGVMFAY